MIYVAGIKIGVAFHKKKKKKKKKKMWLSVDGSHVWLGTKKQNNAF